MKIQFFHQLKFYAGRIFTAFFRISALRVASATFRNLDAKTLMTRRFYGALLHIDVSRSNAQQLLWLQGRRYIKERNLIAAIVKPGYIIVDIGANIGYYALMFAHHTGPRGRIVCLEPEPANLRELHANIDNNRLNELVTVKPWAAGDYDGDLQFAPGLNGQPSPDGSMTVHVVKVDSLQLPHVDMLKIDVEGYEGAVLNGAIKVIKRNKPAIFLELHSALLTHHSHRDIINFLTAEYGSVRAFRVRQLSPLMKVASAYLPFIPIIEEFGIEVAVRQLTSPGGANPCWIIALAEPP
jgi:FkbM family methyltransferase